MSTKEGRRHDVPPPPLDIAEAENRTQSPEFDIMYPLQKLNFLQPQGAE